MGLLGDEEPYKYWNKMEIKNAFVDYSVIIHNKNAVSENS